MRKNIESIFCLFEILNQVKMNCQELEKQILYREEKLGGQGMEGLCVGGVFFFDLGIDLNKCDYFGKIFFFIKLQLVCLVYKKK